jgi:DNA-binding NarL/FixJ family response regulator
MNRSTIRILVVDDFEPWRRFVCSALQQQSGFRVIGEASSGRDAVQKAQSLQPDLIVLDIGLPMLNGIEAARRIRALSPQSKILFLSENRSWDIAEEALRTGAEGYLVKSDAAGELLSAVEAVLEGKRFVSTSLAGNDLIDPKGEHTGRHTRGVVLPFPPQNVWIARRHEVGFYSDDALFLDGFTQFIGTALQAGNAVIVVATESHRENLLSRLQGHGVDISAAIEEGRYISLDAADTLSKVMVNDLFDSGRFLEAATSLIAAAFKAARGEHPRVAVCGECDPPLWALGKGEAAIRLEQLWNEIAGTHDVDILCGYLLGSFRSAQGSKIFQRIRAQHSAVRFP